MKKIIDLKNDKATKIQEMDAILNSAKVAERSFTDEEASKWTELQNDVNSLDRTIEMLTKQDELNRSIVSSSEDKERAEMNKNYSISRAINGYMNNKLDGVEAEIHQEIVRSANGNANGLMVPFSIFNRTAMKADTNTTWALSQISDNLSIIKSRAFLQELGVQFYTGLKGTMKFPYQSQQSATFPGEDTSLAEYTITQGSETLAPRRVGGYKDYTKEFLASNSDAVLNAVLLDQVDAIYRAIGSDLYDNVDSLVTPVTGYASGDTATAVSATVLNALEAALTVEGLGSLAYVTRPAVRQTAKSTSYFTSGNTGIWDGNMMNGYPAFATQHTNTYSGDTKNQLILADWSMAAVGEFAEGFEVLIDPYTNGVKGYQRVIVNMLADTGLLNPGAFALAQNIT